MRKSDPNGGSISIHSRAEQEQNEITAKFAMFVQDLPRLALLFTPCHINTTQLNVAKINL